jgi:deoxyribodipyrimidine photo-lyase
MQTIRLAITLFTRDLRLHHNPALAAALDRAGAVLPVFVLDDRPGMAGRSGTQTGRPRMA